MRSPLALLKTLPEVVVGCMAHSAELLRSAGPSKRAESGPAWPPDRRRRVTSDAKPQR